VLITGGAGFIGSHLADALISRGDEVAIIDDYTTGRRDNVPTRTGQTLVEASICDEKAVGGLFADFKPDRVVHAAASYSDPDNWHRDVSTNALGTATVIRATQKSPAKRLIYFQTSLCYGLHPKEQPITVDHPLLPANSYAISKTAGELYIMMSGMDFISFRLANMFGPRNLSGPVPTFYKRLTEGQPCTIMDARRDFLFGGDLIEIVLMALDGKGNRGVYHVSSGGDLSIKELFDEVLRATGVKLDSEPGVRQRGEDDVYTILLDASKTVRDFGWKAHTPLRTAVEAAVAWYRKHGVTQTFTHLRIENKGGK
jgi:UDP-glucose 4-epimerase